MFSTPPPRTNVQTRRAKERELKLAASEANEVQSCKTCPPMGGDSKNNNGIKDNANQGGSLKLEFGDIASKSSKKSSQKSSLLACKRQLELDAAEAKAAIEKDLIEKRLAVELAALDDDSSQKSRCTDRSSIKTSLKVEQWLEKSHQDLQASHAADVTPVPPAETVPRDLDHLARAIENLALSTQSSNKHFLSRLATPKDLPLFSGESLEWMQFKKVFEESTNLCKYNESENIARLSKCLRGEAREAVSSLLITDTSPKAIISALELRFGRPEMIIYKIASQFKKLQPLPQTYHTELVNFAVKINNYVAAAQSINQTDYLRSPELLNTVLSKCPSALINKWADYIYEHQDNSKAKLQLLSEFLHKEATKVAAAGISHIHMQAETKFYKKTEERKIQSHAVLNNDAADCSNTCKFCKTSVHPLTSCIKFKRALRRDKWRFVKIKKICHKCLLLGHGKETCPAAPCDVDNCGLPHHRLLHWPAKVTPTRQSSSDSNNITIRVPQLAAATSANSETSDSKAETVTNTVVSPSTSVMLKIVRVNLHGPSGVIATHALLDDGATVSLVSADLANCVNLQGQSETLRMRGAWNSDIVCQSEIVQFRVSNINGESYEMRARKINELDLPVQNLSKVKLETYEHLSDLKDFLTCANVKPKLLIGQDNFHLIMTLKTVYRGINEPCATLTPLGWCLHGIVPAPAFANRPLTTELAFTTTMLHERSYPTAPSCAAEPLSSATPADTCAARRETHTCADAHINTTQHGTSNAHYRSADKHLHELVRRSFAIDSIGVNSKPRVNKEERRAIAIVDKSAKLEDGSG